MHTRLATLAALCLLVGCGSDPAAPGTDAGTPPASDAATSPGTDAGAPLPDGSDAGPPAPGLDAGDMGPGPIDASAPMGGGATLTGTITRSAAPAAGGRGSLYIAIFDVDPVMNRDSAMLIASARLEDVDMSGDGASVSYTVPGIPPRAEPYFVTAFLDDNMTVVATDPTMAGPDRGDLIAIMGFASPSVAVTTATEVVFDLDLNFNLPF